VFFWHAGATIALIRYAFRDERMDLRFLVVGAVLPDLLDTPAGLIFWDRFHAVRLAAHSLTFAALMMIAVMVATRRGRPRKRWMPVAVGVLMHLFLDGMWRFPATLWWPFLGTTFASSGFATVGEYLRWLLTDWRTWLGEAVGFGYLAVLARRSHLGEPERLRRFLRTGVVDAPIGR